MIHYSKLFRFSIDAILQLSFTCKNFLLFACFFNFLQDICTTKGAQKGKSTFQSRSTNWCNKRSPFVTIMSKIMKSNKFFTPKHTDSYLETLKSVLGTSSRFLSIDFYKMDYVNSAPFEIAFHSRVVIFFQIFNPFILQLAD